MPTKVFDAFTRLDASDVNAYLANKSISNAIINGAFDIWQRGAGAYTGNVYTADRWFFYGQGSGASHSATRQTFTPGSAPVAGYEGEFFYRDVITPGSDANSQMILVQKIEDVRTFANQTVTMSFWAKANSGTPKIGVEMYQDFGSGGSGAVSGVGQSATISTSWARYSFTFSVPSVSGKIIGTSSNLQALIWLSAGSNANTRSGSIGLQSNTFDIWGVQLETGTVANDFRRNANSIQGELAACQRYFISYGGITQFDRAAIGSTPSTSSAAFTVFPPVEMRATPTLTVSSLSHWQIVLLALIGLPATSLTISTIESNGKAIAIEAAFASDGRFGSHKTVSLSGNSTTAARFNLSAEL
jgi:hypothetical protein